MDFSKVYTINICKLQINYINKKTVMIDKMKYILKKTWLGLIQTFEKRIL